MTPESGPSIDAASAPLAEAWSYNTNAVQDWLARQRAISAQRGMWNDETGLPTQAGVVNALQQWANGVQTGTIRAFHGSPYDFSAFDASKIGTGEGAQTYGHGLYFAEREGVAKGYRDKLAPIKGGTAGLNWELASPGDIAREAATEHGGREAAAKALESEQNLHEYGEPGGKVEQAIGFLRSSEPFPKPNRGHMYEVNLNVEPEQLLDLDKPLLQQSPQIQALARKYGVPEALPDIGRPSLAATVQPTGRDAYEYAADRLGPRPAAQALRDAGIPGAQYLDQGSRQVDFSPILHRDGSQTWGVYLKDRHNTPVAEFKTRKEAEAEAARRLSRNYVMFDPTLIEILRKYGIAGGMLGGAGALSESDKPSAESLTSPRDTNVLRSLAQ